MVDEGTSTEALGEDYGSVYRIWRRWMYCTKRGEEETCRYGCIQFAVTVLVRCCNVLFNLLLL